MAVNVGQGIRVKGITVLKYQKKFWRSKIKDQFVSAYIDFTVNKQNWNA